MADIPAKTVMALRQKTGLSMMECKKALQECNGDMETAIDFLKKKLKGKMETRSDRAAGEGRIGIKVSDDGRNAVIAELRTETDFTAKNDEFAKALGSILDLAMGANAGEISPSDEMKKAVDELRISTGENISVARAHKVEGGSDAMFGSYIHHDGKTGVLLHCTGSVSEDTARDVCMHITAASPRPQGVTRDDVPESLIEKERKLAMEMAIEGGKNEEIAAKMVEGKINKLYSELALLEQPFVKDDSKKINELMGDKGTVSAFYRWEIGEEA